MTDPFQPTLAVDFVGQERLVNRLMVLVEAALLADEPLPHLLFAGPDGTGKSALASALAGELRVPFHRLAMPVDVAELASAVNASGPGVLVITNLHDTPRPTQARLVQLLESGCFRAGNSVVTSPNLTVIGTTSQGQRLDATLYARLFAPTWEPYSPSDLTHITVRMVALAGLALAASTVAALATAAAGVPGRAALLVGTAKTLTTYLGDEREPTIDEILAQAGFAPDGLAEPHFGYLEALELLGGGASPALLSLTTRLHPTVCANVECLLLDRGFIRVGGRGREISQDGRLRLAAHLERRAA